MVECLTCRHYASILFVFAVNILERDVFVRTNHHAIAMMSGTGMHCDHMVHFSTDLSLWFDSTMFWSL